MAERLVATAIDLDNLSNRIRECERAKWRMGAELEELYEHFDVLGEKYSALCRDLPISELLQAYKETQGLHRILNGIIHWRLEPIWYANHDELSIAALKRLKADVDEWVLTVRAGGFSLLQGMYPTADMIGYGERLDEMLYKKTTEHTLALMMGTHSRLGPSNLRNLDVNLLRNINDEALE
jgi:hypothetical protein